MADKRKPLVPAEERAAVGLAVCTWLNTCPLIPVERVSYEYLDAMYGFAVSKEQTAFKSKEYIDGSYQAQFIFHLIYRSKPTTDEERMKMDELLMRIAAWSETSVPLLKGAMTAVSMKCTDDAALVARYDDLSEDHQITLQLTYEVN